jgi:hypothetical protein
VSEQDWMKDPKWNAYVTHVRTELVPMIAGSGSTISLMPKDPADVDVKFAIELGLSIMMEKPLILVIDADGRIPPALESIAHAVVRGDINHESTRAALSQAIESLGLGDE